MSLQIPLSEVDGARLIDLDYYSDFRGSFSRFEFERLSNVPPTSFAVSKNTDAGTTRGLHYQKSPFAQGKLIFCVSGSIDDYFLDLRLGSTSYGKWSSARLDSKSSHALFLPRGFAHGFQTLEANTTLIYLFDKLFVEESSAAYSMLDSKLGIEFALPVSSISDADRSAPYFTQESGG